MTTTPLFAIIVLSLLLVVCRVVQVNRYLLEISRTNPDSFGHPGWTYAHANVYGARHDFPHTNVHEWL